MTLSSRRRKTTGDSEGAGVGAGGSCGEGESSPEGCRGLRTLNRPLLTFPRGAIA